MKTEFILYIGDQTRSRIFYENLLQLKPVLDVPGMTEFALSDSCILGLMPESGIVKILTDKIPHPSSGNGIPRCELYLYVEDIEPYYERAVKSAVLISDIERRGWGDIACYFSDPDGHIIAFAKKDE